MFSILKHNSPIWEISHPLIQTFSINISKPNHNINNTIFKNLIHLYNDDINDFLEKVPFYCLQCGKEIYSKNILNVCSEHTEYICNGIFFNYIIPYYQENKDMIDLYLKMWKKSCIISDTISLNPIPSFFDKSKFILNYDNLIKSLNQSKDDIELSKNISELQFKTIKWFFLKIKFLFKKIYYFNKNKIDKVNTYEIINFSSNFNPEKKETFFAFHGSTIDRWYPITLNGIKIMSNTSGMKNAAAYGSGIYLSQNSSFSFHYSTFYEHSSDNIIGVFEVIGNPRDYYKTTNIFLVNDINKLCLKYIINIYDTTTLNIHSIFDVLNNTFITNIKSLEKTSIESTYKINNKRLNNELKKVTEKYSCIEKGFIIEYPNYNIKFIINDYPFNPPKVYYENIKPICPQVSVSGLLKFDFLHPSKWMPTMTIRKILDEINKLNTHNFTHVDNSTIETDITNFYST